MGRGDLYCTNMRYLRQQILLARERGAPTLQFIVSITVPDQPGLTLDAFLRVDNLYVFGIRSRHAAFYFNDATGLRIMGNQRLLGFGGHYSNLGSYADLSINRGTIAVALTQIAHWRQDQEISNRGKETSQPTSEARHLLLLILMISEAARFFDIERTIANALDGRSNTPLTPQMIQTLTRQWAYLSREGNYRQVAIRNLSP
jgi:hypothetical protein